MATPKIRFFDWPYSPFCTKAGDPRLQGDRARADQPARLRHGLDPAPRRHRQGPGGRDRRRPCFFGRLAYRHYLRRIRGQLNGQGTLRKSPGQFRSDLDRQLEAVDALLTPGPFLIGNRPHLCDFALFGQLVYLSRTPIGAVALDRRDNVERFTASVKIILGAPPPSG